MVKITLLFIANLYSNTKFTPSIIKVREKGKGAILSFALEKLLH